MRTSLVTAKEFDERCSAYLSKGIDILYIACSGSLSGTRNAFELYKPELLEKFPDRKIISIDSCRAEMALGLLVIDAAKMRDQGKSIDEALTIKVEDINNVLELPENMLKSCEIAQQSIISAIKEYYKRKEKENKN